MADYFLQQGHINITSAYVVRVQRLTSNVSTTNATTAAVNELNKSYADMLLPVSVTWGIVALFGVLGNVAVICVFVRDRRLKKRPLKLHTIFMAIVDFFSSVFIIPFEIYKHRNYFSGETNYMCKYKCFFNIITMACTCFVLVLIAANRYLVSSRPLIVYQRENNRKRHVVLKLCLGLALSILISVPLPILCGSYSTRIVDLNGNNISTNVCGPEQKYRFSTFRFAYKYFLTGLQLVLSVLMLVLYTLTARQIRLKWRTSARRSVHFDTSGNLRQDSSAGRLSLNIKVMCGVTLTFVISYLIFAGLSFVDTADVPGNYFAMYAFVYRIYFINCVAMPIMYLKFDEKFRACFMAFLKCERRVSVNTEIKRRLSSARSY